MLDTTGEALAASPDANPSEAPVEPAFDFTQPRLLDRVTIKLDRKRELRLPFKSLRTFEQASGLSAYDPNVLVHPSLPEFKLETLVTFLWAALIDEDPTLTLEQAWELPGLDYGNVHFIRHKLDECWGKNMPPSDPKGTNATGPKSPRAG